MDIDYLVGGFAAGPPDTRFNAAGFTSQAKLYKAKLNFVNVKRQFSFINVNFID